MENFSLITLLQEFRFLLLSFSLALIRSSKFFALFWCFGYLDSSPNEEIYLPEKNLYFDFGGILAIAASFLILKYTPLRNWRLPFSSIFCFAAALAYLFLSTSTIITLGFFLHLSELWLLLSIFLFFFFPPLEIIIYLFLFRCNIKNFKEKEKRSFSFPYYVCS